MGIFESVYDTAARMLQQQEAAKTILIQGKDCENKEEAIAVAKPKIDGMIEGAKQQSVR
jgi:hypothetical protein